MGVISKNHITLTVLSDNMNGYSIVLSSDSALINVDSEGNFSALTETRNLVFDGSNLITGTKNLTVSYNKISTTIQIHKGAKELYFDNTAHENSFTATAEFNGCAGVLSNGTLAITSISDFDNCYVDLTINAEGLSTFKKAFHIKKLNQGAVGSNGRGILSVENYYLASTLSSGVNTSTVGWTTAIQNPTDTKPYLWNYEKVKFTDGTSSNTDPSIIGNYAKNGTDGKGITSIAEYYALNNSTAAPSSGWSTTSKTPSATSRYLWNYEVITYSDNSTYTSNKRIICVYGEKGDAGKGISSITKQYYLSTSKTELIGGTWLDLQPAWLKDTYLWTRDKIIYSDSTTPEYVGVTVSTEWEAAKEVQENLTKAQKKIIDGGFNYEDKEFNVLADKFNVRGIGKNGKNIAVFTTDENGNPLLKAENIDVEDLTVKNLQTDTGKVRIKNDTLEAEQAKLIDCDINGILTANTVAIEPGRATGDGYDYISEALDKFDNFIFYNNSIGDSINSDTLPSGIDYENRTITIYVHGGPLILNGSFRSGGYVFTSLEIPMETTVKLTHLKIYDDVIATGTYSYKWVVINQYSDDWNLDDGNKWYRKHSNGWLECGGNIFQTVNKDNEMRTSVKFEVPFKDNKYSVSLTPIREYDDLYRGFANVSFQCARSTDYLQIRGRANDSADWCIGCTWEAKGWWK